MDQPRIFSRSSPILPAAVLGGLLIRLSIPEALFVYLDVYDWPFTWVLLLLATAIAACLVRRRSRAVWLGAGVTLLMTWQALPGMHWVGGVPWLWRALRAIAGLARYDTNTAAYVLFWMAVTALSGIWAKVFDPDASWGLSVARAAIAVAVSVLSHYALAWLQYVLWPIGLNRYPRLMLIAEFVPAVVLPLLLWRRWRGIVVWVGVTIAPAMMVGVQMLDSYRPTRLDFAIYALVLAIAPMWVYCDWRRTRATPKSFGFEVIGPRAAIPVEEGTA
jgi:hypothetical protein